MKKRTKKVTKKYQDMTPRQRDKLPLMERYRMYFNEYRGAGIKLIARVDDGEGGLQPAVRYLDGREDIRLPDVLTWTSLFDKLKEMHPTILEQVLREMTRATIRERFTPDTLLVTRDQMQEIMQKSPCHGDLIYGMKMLPSYYATKMKAFKGTLR